MVKALVQAGYATQVTELAANILFPVALTMHSALTWQSTGLPVLAPISRR